MPQLSLWGRKSQCHEIQWLLMKVLTPTQNPKGQHKKKRPKTCFLICVFSFSPLTLHTVILYKCNSNETRKPARGYVKVKLRGFSKQCLFLHACSDPLRRELINTLWRENLTALLLSVKHPIDISNTAGTTFSQQALSRVWDLSYLLPNEP